MYLTDDEPPVLRFRTAAAVTLEFERDLPYGPDDPYVTGMLVRALGQFVRIERQVLLPDGLPAFLRGLYDDFRGWPGERDWRSPDAELRVSASHDGYVGLRWTVASRSFNGAEWTFSTTTRHEAGEDVRHLADAFERLLRGPA